MEMTTIPEDAAPTQLLESDVEEKWPNYSQVYSQTHFVYFDELGLLKNGKKRDCPGERGVGPIYPSKEAGEILYGNLTAEVPIKLSSKPSLNAVTDYLLPSARTALKHYQLGLGDGKFFEGYDSPKRKGAWTYVTPTKEITLKDCWIRLENCDGSVVGDSVQEVKPVAQRQDLFKKNVLSGFSPQPQKQSSILQFFCKVNKEKVNETLENKSASPKVGSVKSSNRKKRKCAQMNLTPISKPRRKLPRRKMNWSPIPFNERCSSSSSPEEVVMPRPLSTYKVTPRVLTEIVVKVEVKPPLIQDNDTNSALQTIRNSLTRSKLIREKYSKVFDVVPEDIEKVSMSEVRSRFHHVAIHVPSCTEKSLETLRQAALPGDVLQDVFSLDDDNGESFNYLSPYGTSSTEFFTLLPAANINLSALISFDDFDGIDTFGDAADDDMEGDFNNMEISPVMVMQFDFKARM